MASQNRIILLGEIANDPDLRVTTTGDAMLRLTLDVARPDRGDGAPSRSDAIPIVAWRQVAESGKDLLRGQLALVEGRTIVRTLEDESGNRKWITEVEARDIRSVAGAVGANPPAAGRAGTTSEVPRSVEEIDAPKDAAAFDFEDDKNSLASVDMPVSPAEAGDDDIPF